MKSKFISRFFVVLMIAFVAGGLFFLMSWDVPAPTVHIEENIEHHKLQ